MAVTQVLNVTSVAALSTGSTQYLSPLEGLSVAATGQSTRECIVGAAGTLANLYVSLSVAPGAGKSYAFTVLINGVATSITTTISETATFGSDTTHTAVVAVGDLLTIRSVPSGTPSAPIVTCELEWTGSAAGVSFYGNAQEPSYTSGTTRFFHLFGARAGLATAADGAQQVVPLAGTFTQLRIVLSGSPGAGTSITFVISKDTGFGFVDQDGTGGTPDTRVTIADSATSGTTSFALSVAVGDVVVLKSTPTNTPTGRQVAQTVVFTADTDGAFIWAVAGLGNGNNASTLYSNPRAQDDAWNATESSVQRKHLGSRALLASAIGLVIQTAPGAGKSFTATLRANGSSLGTSVILADTNTKATTAAQTGEIVQNDLMSVSLAPSGTPTVSDTSFAIALGDAGGEAGSARLTQVVIEVLASTATAPAGGATCTGGGTVAAGTNPAAGLALTNTDVPVAWLEIEATSGTKRYAKVAINLDNAPKTARVLSFGSITRRLSNELGDFRSADFSPTLDDTDRVLRGLEDTDALVNSIVAAYVSTESAIRAGSAPRRMFAGPIVDTKPLSSLQFQITCRDWLGALLDELNTRTYPARTFTATDFANIDAVWDTSIYAYSDHRSNPTLVGKPVPIVYGEHIDTEKGGVPGHFTGMKQMSDSSVWYEFILSAGALKKVHSVFGAGDLPLRRMELTANGVDVLWPDTTNALWTELFGSVNYVDYNGRRYTPVYLRGPRGLAGADGTVPVSANVCGLEATGDGTGTMIDSLPRQILHLLVNWILPATPYSSGAWLSPPSFTVGGSTWSKIDTTTFETAKTTSEARIAGGYKGAFVLGWDGRTFTLAEIVRMAARSGDLDFYMNRHGQLAVSMFDSGLATSRAISDVSDTLAASFKAKRRRDRIINKVVYSYARQYVASLTNATPAEDELLPSTLREAQADWGTYQAETSDATSITKYGERRHDLELEFVRAAATANDVATKVKNRLKNGPLIAEFDEILAGADCDISQTLTLDHFEGVTATGYTDRVLRVEGQTVDLDQLTVRQETRDLTGL